MSIIHEALKKAASESTPEISKPNSNSHLFRASVQGSPAYRWIAISISIFALSGFFFYARYRSPTTLNDLRQSMISSELPALNSKTDLEAPRSVQVTMGDKKIDNLESTKGLKGLQEEEGERALIAGIRFHQEGKIEEASSALTKAVELLPLSPIAHNNLGMVLRNQGKTDEALNHYKEAIRLDPNYAEAENNIGLFYDKTGSVDQAAVHYKRAIEIKPMVSLFHLNYATLLERKGDFSNARKEYQLYLDLETDPKSEVILLVRSHLEKLKGF